MLKLSTLQACLIALSVAGYPLVSTVSTALKIDGSAPSIAMRVLVLGLSLAMLLPSLSRLRRQELPYATVLIIFWFAYIMRMVGDTFFGDGTLQKAPSEYWIWALGVSLIPALAVSKAISSLTPQKALDMTWLFLVISSILAALFGSTIATSFSGTETNTGRLGLDSLNPISMGHMGAALVLCSGWKLYCEAGQCLSKKGMGLVSLCLGLYLVVSAASRGPLIALAATLFIVLLTLKPRTVLKVFVAGGLPLIGLLVIAWNSIDFQAIQLLVRFIASSGGEDMSVISRYESFSGAWNQFLNNPLLGDSLEEKSTGYYPHNLTLEAFMSTGFVGGAAFLLINWIAFRKSFQAIKRRSSFAWAGMICLQYMVGAQFSGSISASSTFWAFTFLMVFSNSCVNSDRSSHQEQQTLPQSRYPSIPHSAQTA